MRTLLALVAVIYSTAASAQTTAPSYGGKPLLLSRLKPNYRQKLDLPEKPLMERVALHSAQLALPYPTDEQTLVIDSAWPKDMTVSVKYLRRFAPAGGNAVEPWSAETPSMDSEQPDEPDANE